MLMTTFFFFSVSVSDQTTKYIYLATHVGHYLGIQFQGNVYHNQGYTFWPFVGPSLLYCRTRSQSQGKSADPKGTLLTNLPVPKNMKTLLDAVMSHKPDPSWLVHMYAYVYTFKLRTYYLHAITITDNRVGWLYHGRCKIVQNHRLLHL